MLTRSRKKRLNEKCPISLQKFTESTIVFIHDNIRYDAIELQMYLLINPNAVNPITRSGFSVGDIKYLNAVCANGKYALYGNEAVDEQKILQEERNSLYFLEEELKMILDKFKLLVEQSNYRNYNDYLRDLNINIAEVVADVRQYDHAFDDMLPSLLQFVKEMSFANKDVTTDIVNIIKNGTVNPHETSSDSSSDMDTDSDREPVIPYRNYGLPNYGPVVPPLPFSFNQLVLPPPQQQPPPYTQYSASFNGAVPQYAAEFWRNIRI
jgi:hypothetical protein